MKHSSIEKCQPFQHCKLYCPINYAKIGDNYTNFLAIAPKLEIDHYFG